MQPEEYVSDATDVAFIASATPGPEPALLALEGGVA